MDVLTESENANMENLSASWELSGPDEDGVMEQAQERPNFVDVNFEFGVGVEPLSHGRARCFVRKDIITPEYDGEALRSFMEEIAVAWLEQVAPHRLARGADDR